jgi:hypothetical protein
MQVLNRRRALASLGLMGGSALLSGCGGGSPAGQDVSAGEIAASSRDIPRPAPAPVEPSPADRAIDHLAAMAGNWTYQPLDPVAVGQLAYDMYPQGSCMYAVFGSVITQLADKVGGPFVHFPLRMMRYGATGIGGWGSVCGVVNGCAALVGLFHDEKKDSRRDELISDICLWYEATALPLFQPAEPAGVEQVKTCVSGSVLCHVSVSKWCKANGCDAYSPQRRERCRRMSADGAMRVVELLNGDAGSTLDFVDFTPQTQACIDCHGNENLRDSLGKMSCVSCHQFDSRHP